jgi:hypothetical protein
VRGPSHDSFVLRLADLGLDHMLMSPEARGENSVMIACRRAMKPGPHTAPAIPPSLPYNFLHVELPENCLQVLGIRVPDYSRQPRIRRICWDWLCLLAAKAINTPTVILGDFNADPEDLDSKFSDYFDQLEGDGWQRADPESGASYWTVKNNVPRNLDHAFVSRDYVIASTRYIDGIDDLILMNRSSYYLPDHAVLEIVIENARDFIYTACRRLLDMVRILHQQGFEQLRINPGMSPSGCHWRCEFIPAAMSERRHCSMDEGDCVETANYSSGQKNKYFDWTDADFDPPEKLASKFVERFPELSKACLGKDSEYVNWYSRMLEDTAPDGFIYAYADFPVPEDYMLVQNKPGLKIPHPPNAN